MPLMPLAADWVELIAKGIPVLLFIFWLISQAIGEAAGKPKPRPKAGPRPPARPQPQAGRGPDVLDEMEAFLRRAAEKRDQGVESDAEVLSEPTAAGRPGAKPRREPPRPLREATPSAVSQSFPEKTVGGGISKTPSSSESDAYGPSSAASPGGLQARHTIGSRSFGQHISHLGERVADADDRLVARLESAFDHSVGSLSHQPKQQAEPPSSTAAAIAKMLGSPENVRQAIILNEILRRPVQ